MYPTPQSMQEASDDPLDLIRHITLNTYRIIKNKFGSEYGDIVICQDAGNYWRKDLFPHYKANRKRTESTNKEYWDGIYASLRTMRIEIAENMPYRNLWVERCEADDIIGVLAKHYSPTEKVLIVSNDKDFQQLLVFPNVRLYSYQKKAYVVCPDPEAFLYEQIVRGDSSDGVPNILSEDDTIISPNKRQKPITAKRLVEFCQNIPDENKENFKRNQQMIDLNYIPVSYQEAILEEYANAKQNVGRIYKYFVEHKLATMMESISKRYSL